MLDNAMAITINQARPIDGEELIELSRRNPGYQFERWYDGRLTVTPTGGKSGIRSCEVSRQLAEWNRATQCGVAFDSSTGFHMSDGSVLSPDAAWISRQRWDTLSPAAQEVYPPLCPDVVFEVRSQSNTAEELRAKMRAYVANGAALGVLIDPYNRSVKLWRPNRQPSCFEDESRIAPGAPLDGFVLEIEGLYE